jgi:hypothetical protein
VSTGPARQAGRMARNRTVSNRTCPAAIRSARTVCHSLIRTLPWLAGVSSSTS